MDACPEAPSVRDKMQSGNNYKMSQTVIERASFTLLNIGIKL
jgi:hypothetical protein